MGDVSSMQDDACYDMPSSERPPIVGITRLRYVTCPKLAAEAGTGFIDKERKLVRRKSLKKRSKKNIAETTLTILGVTAECRSLTRGIYLEISESKLFLFHIVDELTRGLEAVLGHKWSCDDSQYCLPPLSGDAVKITTTEKYVRLTERQEVLPGVYCGTCSVECKDESVSCVSCLAVSLSTQPLITLPLPKLIKPPCSFEGQAKNSLYSHQRLNAFNKSLRLSHAKGGGKSNRELCEEYADIFKPKRDNLTAIATAMHHIPTPYFPKVEQSH
jgi:hypothetical protein